MLEANLISLLLDSLPTHLYMSYPPSPPRIPLDRTIPVFTTSPPPWLSWPRFRDQLPRRIIVEYKRQHVIQLSPMSQMNSHEWSLFLFSCVLLLDLISEFSFLSMVTLFYKRGLFPGPCHGI